LIGIRENHVAEKHRKTNKDNKREIELKGVLRIEVKEMLSPEICSSIMIWVVWRREEEAGEGMIRW